MILYLDTSPFLKLYLEEPDSGQVRSAVDAASAVCSHMIAYAEMRSALAQANRMKRVTDAEHAHQKKRFQSDWSALQVITVDEPIIRRAGDLADQHGLRGYDSVHLAAAESVWRIVPRDFRLAAFDLRINEAARALGMPILIGD